MEHTLRLFCGGPLGLNPEDALPIVEDNFLLVADGLGGSGGFSHAQLSDEAKQRETFFDTVFSGVFSSSMSEENFGKIRAYAQESLALYFDLSDEQKADRRCVFTSGYFASRLVSTMMYGYLLELGEKGVSDIIDEFLCGENDISALQDKWGEYFTAKISDGLKLAAANGNFYIEGNTSGSMTMLLPTTLVTELYRENEDSVDVVYLWAGDSRGYFWDRKGLLHITKDHENDGVMYNQINLSGKFQIDCKYLRIPKPCMLFCTSDGCYSCMGSPLHLEYFFFDAFRKADSYDQAAKLLQEMYESISEDDANTIAMRIFGYESYTQLKEVVIERLEELHATYAGELPDIFKVNYVEIQLRAKKIIRPVAKKLSLAEYSQLATYVSQQLGSDLMQIGADEEDSSEQEIRSLIDELHAMVREHYWEIVTYIHQKRLEIECYDSKDLACYKKENSKHEKKKSKHMDYLDEQQTKLENVVSVLREQLERLRKLDSSTLKSARPSLSVLHELTGKLTSKKFYDKAIAIKKEEQEAADDTQAYVNKHPDYVERIVDGLKNGVLGPEIFPNSETVFRAKEILDRIEEIHRTREDRMMQCVQRFWSDEKNRQKRIDLLSQMRLEFPDDPMWQSFDAAFVEALDQYGKAGMDIEKRAMLVERYNGYYYSMQNDKQEEQTDDQTV